MTGPQDPDDPHFQQENLDGLPEPDVPEPDIPDLDIPEGSGPGAGEPGGGEGPPGLRGGRGQERRRGSYDPRAHVALLGEQIRRLRSKVDAVGAEQRSTHATLTSTTGHVAELLPRVNDLERNLDALADQVGAPAASSVGTPGSDGNAAGAEDTPVPTPAMGWDAMDVEVATAAWEALARFVGEVLHAQYRLTRLQLPDCWALHPRLVRELAWLRSSYVDAATLEDEVPTAATPWHVRALPAFFVNTADAVDPRECRPGVHRLTEPEVDAYLSDLTASRDAGRPNPAVSSESGPDRPRLRPEHFPRRSTSPRRSNNQPDPPTARTLPDLLVGSCQPAFWLDYYREASAADLQRHPPPAEPDVDVDVEV